MTTAPDDHPMNKYTHLLRAYLAHLQAEVAPSTYHLYETVLWRVHRDLPTGVVAAGEDDLREWIVRDGWSASTRRTYTSAIAGLHTWLRRHEHTSYNPVELLPRIRMPRRLPRPYTAEQVKRILTCTTGTVRLAAHVAAYTGARCLEISRLDRAEVSRTAIRLHGKGDRERLVPTHEVLWPMLEPLPAGPVIGHPRTSHRLSHLCVDAFRELGVDGGLHRLRHTFATMTLAATRDLRAVQELLGHASPSTTAGYAAVQAEAMRSAIQALPTWTD